MENAFEKTKAAVILVMTILSSWLGILAVPVLVLLALEIVDYVTGLAAAKYREQDISSYKSIKGITKKLFMLALVGIAAGLDWLILFAGECMGFSLPFNFVIACLAAVWLICNEIISIIENMNDIGVPMPPFLQTIAKYIKQQTETKTNFPQETEKKEEE